MSPTREQKARQDIDAFLVGLTATPSKQTLGFFNKNLVMEYDHARAAREQPRMSACSS